MTLRFALLGAWHVHARHHVKSAQTDPNSHIEFIYDSDPARGTRFAAEHGLAYEPRLDRLLEDADLDAVIVDSSTAEHVDLISQALRAGKHVFSEKVLTIATADAVALARAATDENRALRVSFPGLLEPATRRLQELIATGDIGTVTGSHIRYAHNGAVGTPWIPEHFFDPAQTGGGAIIDLGAHPIYLSMAIHSGLPQSVHAITQFVTSRAVEDNAAFTLAYPDAISSAEVSMVGSAMGRSLEISGTEGSILMSNGDDRLRLRQGNDPWRELSVPDAPHDTFEVFLTDLASDRWRETQRDHLDLAIGVTQTIEAAYRSAHAGIAVNLDRVIW